LAFANYPSLAPSLDDSRAARLFCVLYPSVHCSYSDFDMLD
jgi:hypothetical protein